MKGGGFDQLMLALKSQRMQQLPEAGDGPLFSASKNQGFPAYNLGKLNSVNNLNEQGTNLYLEPTKGNTAG